MFTHAFCYRADKDARRYADQCISDPLTSFVITVSAIVDSTLIHIHCVDNNFGKCGPIFTILSPIEIQSVEDAVKISNIFGFYTFTR